MSAPKPPTDNVTFLFTDIVGSTEMWEQHGDAFLPVLQAHNAIINDAIARYGGYLFKTEGDAFKVAFSDPANAVKCAILAQAALQRFPWPQDVGAVHVRMAVHTGKPFQQGDDYFGPSLNRTARILSTAHGGQILLSDETLIQIENRMETGTRFLDQGYHRLKDLDAPVRLYHVTHTALEQQNFPPPRSLNGHANNLPTQRRSFIGREKEIEQIASAFVQGDNRLLTLTGPQGSGKTRLALQASAEYIHLFPDGVWIVRLAQAVDVVGAAIEVADTMGIPLPPGSPPLETVRNYLASRSCLLILDDVGNVPQADRLIRELLSGTASLRCLATSRQSLEQIDLSAEAAEIALPELSRPPLDATPAELMGSEAGRLFVERAREEREDFDLTPQRARGISRLLQRDTMPAPIENMAGMLKLKQASMEVLSKLREHGREAVEALKKVGETPEVAHLLESFAALDEPRNPEEAERKLREVLDAYRQLGNAQGVAETLRRLGNLAFRRRRFDRAIMLLSAAREAFAELKSPEALQVREDMERVHRAAGHMAAQTPMSLDKAISLAMEPE